ncbi:MAG: zinc-binding dehydrogenase [Chloroherpetonaceae bacterium]|nr:zinc-binding dehydrogenase [Chloroherpetonaceae bacterium]
MKKVIISNGRLELVEAPPPELHDDEVEIEVKAVGVNFADIKVRKGYTPQPDIPMPGFGYEVAGIVRRTGRDAHRFAIGDRVFGVSHYGGGYAERVVMPEFSVFRLPLYMSFEEGAGFPVAFQTAYHLLKTAAQVQAGDTVLIYSAGGATGTALVQLAKLFGCTVIAEASADHKLQRVAKLGADFTINSTQESLREAIRRYAPDGVQVILNGKAGAHFPQNIELLAMRGKIVLYGNSDGMPPAFDPYSLVYRSAHLIGFSMRSITADPEHYQQTYNLLLQWRKEGKWKVEIGHCFPLSEAMKAHELLESRQSYGKIILVP